MKLFAIMLSLGIAVSAMAQIPENGLVCYYPFNGNADDASTWGNHGTVLNAVLSTDRNGNPNSAYRFNGVDSYIEVPSSLSLKFTSGLTVSAWVRTDPEKPQYANSIVTKGVDGPGGPTPADWSMIIFNENNAGMHCRSHAFLQGNLYSFDGPTVLEPGAWYHLVMTYDGITLKSYVNGEADGARTYSASLRSTTSTLRIGVYDVFGAPGWFAGDIDDILVYNRALSAQEITRIYAGGTAGSTIPVTLPLRPIQKGMAVEIPITVGQLTGTNILAYQFTLQCDDPQDILSIQKTPIVSGTLSAQSGWTVNTNVDSAGQITVGAFGSTPLSGSGTLVVLKGLVSANASPGDQVDLTLSSFLFNTGAPAAELSPGRLTVANVACGDADTNGTVQAYDAAVTIRDAIGIAPLSTQGRLNADVDLNGTVQAFDAALILRKAIGLPPPGGVTTCFAGTAKGSADALMTPKLNPVLSWAGVRNGSSVARLRFTGEDTPGLLSVMMTIEAPAAHASDWSIHLVDLPADYTWMMHQPAAGKWTLAVLHPTGVTLKDLTVEVASTQQALLKSLRISSPSVNATTLPDMDLAGAAESAMPAAYKLVNSYPNPFNPSTAIVFDVPAPSPVTIEVFDVLGVLVKTLVNGVQDPGRHEIGWDGTNTAGRMVSSGQYYCRMRADSYVGTLRLMLLK